jgi:hypothetical protein
MTDDRMLSHSPMMEDSMSNSTLKNDPLDLVRSDRAYYTASTTPQLTQIQTVRVVAVEGRGSPGGPEHIRAIQALYAVMQGVQQLAETTTSFVVPRSKGSGGLRTIGRGLKYRATSGGGNC